MDGDASKEMEDESMDAEKKDDIQGKISVAYDIFNNSTSREYLISLQRFKRAQEGGARQQPMAGGFGLVNLAERRRGPPPNLNAGRKP